MNIEDLVQLLNNRLREFKLSGDYARMSGDLERMNVADKEVISLEDTLFKLKLLIDTSNSAAVKEDILAEVLTDGSVAVLGEYDITPYATDPLHEQKIMNILSKMGVMDTAEKIDDYINGKYFSSPVTGEMIMSAASAYSVDARLMMAIMEQDSSFGTAGVAVRTLNPGNVGNNDAGDTVTYESWQAGVTAVAGWLSRHRGSTTIPEIPEQTIVVPTSTPTAIEATIPVTTSTTTITIATSTPTTTATTTPAVIPTIVEESLTPTTTTSTPAITTSTTTTTIATSTPTTTASTTPTVIPSEAVADEGSLSTTTTPSSTPAIATSTPEIIPVTTSTTTTATTTSTETPTTQ